MKLILKWKEYGLNPESVGTVSKIKIWCTFTDYVHQSPFWSLRREDGPSDPKTGRVTKEIYLLSP